MAIPKFDEIRIEALRLLQKGESLRTKDFLAPLVQRFRLTESEVEAMYPSGNGYVFYDRISWALSYLYLSKLVDRPKRGVYRINDVGADMLSTRTEEQINAYIEKAVQDRTLEAVRTKKRKEGAGVPEAAAVPAADDLTPQENLYRSFEKIRKSVFAEILTTIISKTPREFERLVVRLLQAMGYGGEVRDSGHVTRATGDGGIDGIIKEDILGFGRIYIQAKRYGLDHAIRRDEVQRFVGALAVAKSNKGVFITTSCFTRGAVEYVRNLNRSATIVLIDGERLAEYIYDFGLGMQSEQTIEIKKLDTDFWDSMEDDKKAE